MAIIGNPIITSGGKFFAAIQVNYSTGATCTCSNGTKTMTAPTTNGKYTFLIPKVTLPSTWTISCTDGIYSNSKNVTINEKGDLLTVTLFLVDPILNNNSWEQISQVAQSGLGDTYWDVGDTKEIILNGKIGDCLTLNNYRTYIYILDFNHPTNKTIADNNIIFGGFKTTINNGSDICLCDSKYDSYPGPIISFSFNHHFSSGDDDPGVLGGWGACDFRYDILGAVETQPQCYRQKKSNINQIYNATMTAITNPVPNTLMAALPSDFRNVLKLHTHYTNNVDQGDSSSSIQDTWFTPIIDAGIFLLTGYEITGKSNYHYGTECESLHQTQMQYYTVGNSYKKYQSNNSTRASYFLASLAEFGNASISTGYPLIVDYADYYADSIMIGHPSRSFGLSPAFKI